MSHNQAQKLLSVFQIYKSLLQHYGEQNWWPAETPFEVMVGAILTQNTSWRNVEKAIDNLKDASALDAGTLSKTSRQTLAGWLRPVGYFNVKALRLQNFCHWYIAQGGFIKLKKQDTHNLRHALLSVNGVGPETADDMLLYAFQRPVFVIDAYTRRLFQRLGYVDQDSGYEKLRTWFEKKLHRVENKVQIFNEYHALIVHHAKYYCKKNPACAACCLKKNCKARID
jgi:endonuclease-3 related protein